MFSNNKEVNSNTPVKGGSQRNVLAVGTTIVGEIKSDGDFRVDGVIEGNIDVEGRIVVGQTGSIKGSVVCVDAEIEGSLSGTIKVSNLLSLKESANVTGDVTIGKLAIEPGAIFDATCTMKGSVKTLDGTGKIKSKKAV